MAREKAACNAALFKRFPHTYFPLIPLLARREFHFHQCPAQPAMGWVLADVSRETLSDRSNDSVRVILF